MIDAFDSAKFTVERLYSYHVSFSKSSRRSLPSYVSASVLSSAGFSCTLDSKIACLCCCLEPDLDLLKEIITKADVSIVLVLIIQHLKGPKQCHVCISCYESFFYNDKRQVDMLTRLIKNFEFEEANKSKCVNDYDFVFRNKSISSLGLKFYDRLSFDCLLNKCKDSKDMRCAEARLLTFKDWTFQNKPTPLALASDGFYFFNDTIANDSVKCVYCGLVLCQWEEADTVSVEHKDKSPNCPFKNGRLDREIPFNDAEVYYHRCLMLFTDATFIEYLRKLPGDEVNEVLRRVAHLFDAKESQMLSNRNVFSLLSADIVCEATANNHVEFDEHHSERSQVASSMKLKKKYMSSEEINEVILRIKDENLRLKESKLCKICVDKDIDTVFLPCGHLVSCKGCAPKLRNCAVCRTLIRGTVLAFIPNE